MTRTDCHRPAAIIPANYHYFTSYNLATVQDGWPIPSYNLDVVLNLMKTSAFVKTGGVGKCSICGANFIFGDIFVYEPTGEFLHVGHNCSDKYSFLADRSAYELELGNIKAAAARECLKAARAEERQAFLNAHPGLEEALKTDHYIVRDIAARFQDFRTLSDKQVALVKKIADQVRNPAPAEKNVPAPSGRTTFTGTVVSAKVQEGLYGAAYKMTVKVATDDGVWLAWGTVPAAMVGASGLAGLRGAQVEVTATLEAGREPHFVFMKRPTGKVVAPASVQ